MHSKSFTVILNSRKLWLPLFKLNVEICWKWLKQMHTTESNKSSDDHKSVSPSWCNGTSRVDEDEVVFNDTMRTWVIKLYLPTKIIFSFIFSHLRCFFLQHRRKTSAWIMKLKSHFNFNSENVLFILKSRIMFNISNNICLTKESEI